MESVVLVIHLILALAIIGLVMLQRSEGGGLGIGGSGGMGGFASAHTTANVMSRITGICAAGFFATSLILGILSGAHNSGRSVMDSLDKPSSPAAAATSVPGEPAPEAVKDAAKEPAKDEAKSAAPVVPAEEHPLAPVSK